jgi:DNA invertase Pin-like site-specific DNA recombinase
MAALLIGYARCSTDQQDLTAQLDGLAALGVDINRVYADHGLTGTNRERQVCVKLWPVAAKATRWW